MTNMCKNKVYLKGVLYLIHISLAISFVTSKIILQLCNVCKDTRTDNYGYFGCFVIREV